MVKLNPPLSHLWGELVSHTGRLTKNVITVNGHFIIRLEVW